MEKQAENKRLDNMDNTINMQEIINMQKTFANATIQRTDVRKPETPLPISKKSKSNKLISETIDSSDLPIQVFNNENLGKDQPTDNSSVQTFSNTEFGNLDILMIDNKPYFPATKCAEILGYVNPRKAIIDHCKGVTIRDSLSLGGKQPTKYIPEGDLYRLIVRSNLPSAERFEKWVFDEVLPSIRKHGVYVTPEKLVEFLATPESMIQIFTALHNEQQARIKAETKLNEAQPKITFANAVSQSNDSIQMGVFVKFLKQNGIDIGRTRLFKWLRDNDYLCSFGEVKNYPTQYSMENKWFTVKESYYVDKSNELKLGFTTLVTPKGQQYFINKFLNEAYA